VVVEAEVKEAQGRPLFGVNAEVRSKEVKKSLTGPTLLEMSGFGSVHQVLSPSVRAEDLVATAPSQAKAASLCVNFGPRLSNQ